MKHLILCLIFQACVPTQRYVMHQCPTQQDQMVDVIITGAALLVSVLKYNAHEDAEAVSYFALGMGVALTSNTSECRTVP